MPLSDRQRSTIWQIVAAGVVSLAAIGSAYRYLPFEVPRLDSAADRIAFALRWEALAALALALGVVRVAQERFMTDTRLDGSPPGPADVRLEIERRYLQNTLEQFVLALAAHLALATQLTGRALRLVPILAVWFLIARAVFFVSYRRAPLQRGYGFAATWLPTLAVLLYVAGSVVLG
jgi:uncharacterized MAPEG superfamily protein